MRSCFSSPVVVVERCHANHSARQESLAGFIMFTLAHLETKAIAMAMGVFSNVHALYSVC